MTHLTAHADEVLAKVAGLATLEKVEPLPAAVADAERLEYVAKVAPAGRRREDAEKKAEEARRNAQASVTLQEIYRAGPRPMIPADRPYVDRRPELREQIRLAKADGWPELSIAELHDALMLEELKACQRATGRAVSSHADVT